MSRGKQVFVRMDPDDYGVLEAEASRTGKAAAALLREAFLASRQATAAVAASKAPKREDGPMAEVFLCEAGQLNDESRQALREAGIVVVEAVDPSRCRFIRSGETVTSTGMLWAAVDALKRNPDQYHEETSKRHREQFARNVMGLIEQAYLADKKRREIADA